MNQKGFTLIEILVALPIALAVTLVAAASIFQIAQGRVDIAQKSVAIADIDSASHWLSRDLVLAYTTSLIDGAQPVSDLVLNWSDLTAWAADDGSVTHSVSYAYSGNQLLRTYDGEETIVGRKLTYVGFSLDDKLFTVTLSSQGGLPGSEVTRSFSIEMRTDLEY